MKTSTAFAVLALLAASANAIPLQLRRDGECPCAVLDPNKDLDKVGSATSGESTEPVIQLVPGENGNGPTLITGPNDIKTDKVFRPLSTPSDGDAVFLPPADQAGPILPDQQSGKGDGQDVTVHVPIDGKPNVIPLSQNNDGLDVPADLEDAEDEVEPFSSGNPAFRLGRPKTAATGNPLNEVQDEAEKVQGGSVDASRVSSELPTDQVLSGVDISSIKPNSNGALIDGRPIDPVLGGAGDVVDQAEPVTSSIQGVKPTVDNISQGSAPLSTNLQTVGTPDEIDATVVEAAKAVEEALHGMDTGVHPVNDAATGGKAQESELIGQEGEDEVVKVVDATVTAEALPADDSQKIGGDLIPGTEAKVADLTAQSLTGEGSDVAAPITDSIESKGADVADKSQEVPAGISAIVSGLPGDAVSGGGAMPDASVHADAQTEGHSDEKKGGSLVDSATKPGVLPADSGVGDSEETEQPLSQFGGVAGANRLATGPVNGEPKLSTSSVDPAKVPASGSASDINTSLPETSDISKANPVETPEGAVVSGHAADKPLSVTGSNVPSAGSSISNAAPSTKDAADAVIPAEKPMDPLAMGNLPISTSSLPITGGVPAGLNAGIISSTVKDTAAGVVPAGPGSSQVKGLGSSPISTSSLPIIANADVLTNAPVSVQGVAAGLTSDTLPRPDGKLQATDVKGFAGGLISGTIPKVGSAPEDVIDLVSDGVFGGTGKVLLGKKPMLPGTASVLPTTGEVIKGSNAAVKQAPGGVTSTAQNDLAQEGIETCRECVEGVLKPADDKIADANSLSQSDPLHVKPELEQSVKSKTADTKDFVQSDPLHVKPVIDSPVSQSPVSPECATSALDSLPERTVPCSTNFGGRVGNNVDLCIARDQLQHAPAGMTPCPDNMQSEVTDKIRILGRDENDESWDMLDARRRDMVGQYVRLCMIANKV